MVIFLHLLLANVVNAAAAAPTVYDQRQSGKTNVRLEVKDAVIIAIGDGEIGGDYDYNYDYSDLTVKPVTASSTTFSPISLTPPTPPPTPKPTTQKTTSVPSTSPHTFNLTQSAAVVLEAENNSIIFPPPKPANGSSNTIKLPTTSFKPDQIPVVILQENTKAHKFLPVKTVEKQYLSSSQIRGKLSNSSSIRSEDLPPRHCSPGFFLDNHNRCKRIRRPVRERPQLPTGLRFDHRPLTGS